MYSKFDHGFSLFLKLVLEDSLNMRELRYLSMIGWHFTIYCQFIMLQLQIQWSSLNSINKSVQENEWGQKLK